MCGYIHLCAYEHIDINVMCVRRWKLFYISLLVYIYIYIYTYMHMNMHTYIERLRARGVRFHSCATNGSKYFAFLSKWRALPRSSREVRVVRVGGVALGACGFGVQWQRAFCETRWARGELLARRSCKVGDCCRHRSHQCR